MSFPILIYAAGKGTRMAELTRTKPKPMIKVAGKRLIDHALELRHDIPDAKPCVVNLHYFADQLRHHLTGRDVLFSDETEQLLETGGGLRKAMPLLNGSPVITLNSDAVWVGPNPLKALIDAWDNKMEALLLTIPQENAFGHSGNGDFIMGADGRLARGTGEIYSGAQIIRTDRLSDISDEVFSTNMLWDKIAENGGLHGVSYSGKWCDVGRPSSIPIAEEMLKGSKNV